MQAREELCAESETGHEKETRVSLWWKKTQASLSFYFLTGFHVTLNWFFSALSDLEWLLNSSCSMKDWVRHKRGFLVNELV